MRADRKDYEERLANEIKENVNAFWKYVNNTKKTRSTLPNLKQSNGTFTSSDEQKAEALNNQFASVFTMEDLNNMPNKESLNIHCWRTYISQRRW